MIKANLKFIALIFLLLVKIYASHTKIAISSLDKIEFSLKIKRISYDSCQIISKSSENISIIGSKFNSEAYNKRNETYNSSNNERIYSYRFFNNTKKNGQKWINTFNENKKILLINDFYTAKEAINFFSIWSIQNDSLEFQRFIDKPLVLTYAGVNEIQSALSPGGNYIDVLLKISGGDGGSNEKRICIYKMVSNAYANTFKKKFEFLSYFESSSDIEDTITMIDGNLKSSIGKSYYLLLESKRIIRKNSVEKILQCDKFKISTFFRDNCITVY